MATGMRWAGASLSGGSDGVTPLVELLQMLEAIKGGTEGKTEVR
jgi:hypothetical protein